MKKILGLIMVFVLALSGCSTSSNETVVVGGSTSVEPLLVAMIEDYNAQNPDATPVTYDATGSSAGVENTLNGSYDVGAASREITDDELDMDENLTVETLAYDGIAVAVNPENSVSELTMDELRGIYTGEISNWSEVGGDDADIAVISRDSASGTRGAFEEIVDFEGELVSSSQESSSNGEVMTNITDNPYAIGYVSFDYVDDSVKTLDIDGASPTVENVKNDTYGISRPFNMLYLESNENEAASDFINFVNENIDEYVDEIGLIGV